MKFWLATANLKRIEECLRYGIFEGVITNPAVVAEENTRPEELFKEICRIAPRAYYQLAAGSRDEMLEEAQRMLEIDPERMLIKVPATREGFGVIRALSEQGQEVMATAVPTNTWMILAAAAGARQVAPYSSMLKRAQIISKMEGVLAMQRIIEAQNLDLELCTGIYHATEIPRYAARGVRSAFLWEKDVEAYLTQDLVDQALANFRGDWETIQKLY